MRTGDGLTNKGWRKSDVFVAMLATAFDIEDHGFFPSS
jgi:hypothetical protein